MADNIVLSASIRANLLSLQGTNSLMDKTQLNLSTGKKVNSALDNAVSFFTAKSLTDRASDLNSLLDSMGQSISSLNQANTSATSLTKLVDQANSIANQARDALTKGAAEAKVTGERDLRSVTDLTTIPGVANTSRLTFTVADKEGNAIDLNGVAAGTAADVDIDGAAVKSVDDLVAKINELNNDFASPVLEAKVNSSGQLEIKALNGGRLSIDFFSVKTDATTRENDTANRNLATALGFGSMVDTVADGTLSAGPAQQNDVRVSTVASASLTSSSLHNGTGVAKASDLLTDLFTDAAGTTQLIENETAADDDALVVGINNEKSRAYNIKNLTVEELITKINGDFSGQLNASFDEATGRINIRSVDANVDTVQFGVQEDTATDTALIARFGFGVLTQVATDAVAGTIDKTSVESIRLGAAASDLATFESDYNKIRDQIDSLVKDAGYRGTNLLKGDDLLTTFNEDRSTSITTKGKDLTSVGLGLNAANFGTAASVDASLTQVRGATNTLRTFASSLANDLNVIQTREDFTKQTINTLQAGADKLTIADPNEEGAKMLALQTRQQLAVSALSLASQAQQSVLSLLR